MLQGITSQVQTSFSSVHPKQCSHLYLLQESTGTSLRLLRSHICHQPRFLQKSHIGTEQLLCWIAQSPGKWSRKGLSVRHRLHAKKAEQQLQKHRGIHRAGQWKGQLQRGSGQFMCMVGQGSATGASTAKINVLKHYDALSSLTPQSHALPFEGNRWTWTGLSDTFAESHQLRKPNSPGDEQLQAIFPSFCRELH